MKRSRSLTIRILSGMRGGAEAARIVDLALPSPEALAAAAGALEAAGFVRRGDTWARFDAPAPYAVELVDARRTGLPDAALAELFAEAEPAPGYERLLRPAPAHAL